MTDTSRRAHDRLALARRELALLAGAAVTMGLAGLAEPLHRIKSIVEDAQQDLAAASDDVGSAR